MGLNPHYAAAACSADIAARVAGAANDTCLLALGAKSVLLKGGHLDGPESLDLFLDHRASRADAQDPAAVQEWVNHHGVLLLLLCLPWLSQSAEAAQTREWKQGFLRNQLGNFRSFVMTQEEVILPKYEDGKDRRRIRGKFQAKDYKERCRWLAELGDDEKDGKISSKTLRRIAKKMEEKGLWKLSKERPYHHH